jgi:uridine phosphorylase
MGVLKLPKYLELPGGIQPSIRCKKGDIAEYVLLTNTTEMAGRCAAHLTDGKLIGRGDSAGGFADTATYTGKVDDVKLSVSCSGIGSAFTSTSIEELINIGARVLLLVGSCGALQENMNCGDIVIAAAAVRDEGTTPYYVPLQYPAIADYRLVHAQVRAAEKLGLKYHVGIIRSTSGLYCSQRTEELVVKWKNANVLGVEMETAAVLTVCALRGVYGGAALAVVGNLVTGVHYLRGDFAPNLAIKAHEDAIKVNVEAAKILVKEHFPPK